MPLTDNPKVTAVRRRSAFVDLVVETLDGMRRHQTGRNAAFLTYYGFLTLFPLFLAAYLPGRIQRLTKHPMLVATKLWAVAHLLANGMLADVVLFGAFLAWAVADRISLKRREPVPVPGAPASRWNDLIAVVAGLGLYLAFVFGAHRWLIGVSPMG